jgi:hypothetical protein
MGQYFGHRKCPEFLPLFEMGITVAVGSRLLIRRKTNTGKLALANWAATECAST